MGKLINKRYFLVFYAGEAGTSQISGMRIIETLGTFPSAKEIQAVTSEAALDSLNRRRGEDEEEITDPSGKHAVGVKHMMELSQSEVDDFLQC